MFTVIIQKLKTLYLILVTSENANNGLIYELCPAERCGFYRFLIPFLVSTLLVYVLLKCERSFVGFMLSVQLQAIILMA